MKKVFGIRRNVFIAADQPLRVVAPLVEVVLVLAEAKYEPAPGTKPLVTDGPNGLEEKVPKLERGHEYETVRFAGEPRHLRMVAQALNDMADDAEALFAAVMPDHKEAEEPAAETQASSQAAPTPEPPIAAADMGPEIQGWHEVNAKAAKAAARAAALGKAIRLVRDEVTHKKGGVEKDSCVSVHYILKTVSDAIAKDDLADAEGPPLYTGSKETSPSPGTAQEYPSRLDEDWEKFNHADAASPLVDSEHGDGLGGAFTNGVPAGRQGI